MEYLNIEFNQNGSNAVFEIEHSAFDMHASGSTEPDEDEEEDEDEEDDEEKGNDDSNENDPPLDDNVVHSPLPPQTGGKPGTQIG